MASHGSIWPNFGNLSLARSIWDSFQVSPWMKVVKRCFIISFCSRWVLFHNFVKEGLLFPCFFPRRGVLAGAVTAASFHRKFSGSNVAVWSLDHNESHKHGTAKCIADEEFVGHLGCWCVSLVCLAQVEKFGALATWKALYVAIARRVSKIYCWSTEIRGGVGIFFVIFLSLQLKPPQ